MKVKDALISDYRKPEVKEFIQEKLKQIPALSKYSESDKEIPLNVLEKFLWKLYEKYGNKMQYIMPTLQPSGEAYYTCSFKTKDHNWIGTINGLTIYEIYAKGALMCYCYSKSGGKNLQ